MANKIKTITVLRQNYREVIIVFLAFALMGLSAYFFIGRILKGHLLDRTGEIMYTAEANVRAGLSEAETTLLNSYYIVQGMMERSVSRQDILDYLSVTTEWMRRRERGLLDYYGIYGFINGEFYDSIGLNAGDDYIPQRRPWYQTAVRSGNTVAYTAPYEDERTGDTIVSAVRNIDINGNMVGILAVDINIKRLEEYIRSLSPVAGGYGMLLGQNMTIMAHPDSAFMGRQLQDLGASYAGIARSLRGGNKVFDRLITNSEGFLVNVFFQRIFNGWYVGIVIPYFRYNKDFYLAAVILVLLGLILSLALSFIQLRLSAARMRADKDSKSKSSFLASMSHEIRTPMNAITGMAELLLRETLSDEARGYAQDIKQAGSNLISIINDILDFSKIEAGKLEIISTKYLLSSLVNDTVNIIRMRLGEKPLQFFTGIDGRIPNSLFGDEVRLRQILLNLLSNAVKYSEIGHISLSITIDKREGARIYLKIAVTDTGKGITPEDQTRLFDDFSQVDTKKNRGIEGTGLGLAITKRLCVAMGGDIGVESEYGKGSVFTAIIPQEIESEEPFAEVENPLNKKVLVYEDRAVYARSLRWTLENLNVPYILVMNTDDFAEALLRTEWFCVFAAYGLYTRIKPVMEQPETVFPGGKRPQLALMVERGTEDYIPDIRFVSLPMQALFIANLLNGKVDIKGYAETSGTIRFTIPTARILVVDDIATNLKVAEGLLAPYQAVVDTSLSGIQAVELVKQHDYDIVFMDHMMPDMDGIEATAAIREWEVEKKLGKKGAELGQEASQSPEFDKIPIVALTANAVVGMREMFLEKGFNDFLAKPIDISKMDEILAFWIAKEKREKAGNSEQRAMFAGEAGYQHAEITNNDAVNSLTIPGVDVQKGIAMTGGTLTAYKQVLSLFRKDVEERLPLLQTMPSAETLSAFVTNVHALKSASASLGAAEVSVEAAQLEAAGKAGETAFIQENLPLFANQLAELVHNIGDALDHALNEENSTEGKDHDSPISVNISDYLPVLRELAEVLRTQNISEIDRVIDMLSEKQFDEKTEEALEEISTDVLMAEFDSALKTVEELIKRG